MPDGIDLKRIIDLDPETTVTDDDYTIVDSTTGGAKKFALGQALGEIKDGFDDLDDRVTTLEQGGTGGGLTDDIKQALLQIASKIVYVDEHGQEYYDDLYDALYPPAELVSISCVYTQSGTVYDTDSLDSLKSDLVVTAHYSDQTTEAVTTYTLSGTLTAGTSTITVSYSGKTTTFTVTVTAAPTLTSISAVYTQSGTVYETDSLDSLKSDLVVTAIYSDSSTETVTTYTLSGTLTEGTSTITVSYGGKTTTFNVTVTSAPTNYLYNWDLTQSLIDSVNSQEIVLNAASGTSTASMDSSGLHFTAGTQNAYLGQIEMPGKTIEIDVASFAFAGNTSSHIRFLMNSQYTTTTSKGLGALIYKSSTGWTSYGWTSNSGTSAGWSSSLWDSSLSTNAFNGKTVKVVYDSDGHTQKLYLDDSLVGTLTDIYFNNTGSTHYSDKMFIGGQNSLAANSGDQCYNMTITGIRIYANN